MASQLALGLGQIPPQFSIVGPVFQDVPLLPHPSLLYLPLSALSPL